MYNSEHVSPFTPLILARVATTTASAGLVGLCILIPGRRGTHAIREQQAHGKVVEQWVESDDLGLWQQLGVVPPLPL